MITKTAFALALVWLCGPHNPAMTAAAKSCVATGSCSFAQGSEIRREMIFTRLHEMRAEIRQARKS
jgi:hypothetical protein